MSVPLWVERARAELGRIGGPNKEVASELFVSVRTVEVNLTCVYSKFGVRSRTELAVTPQAARR